MWRQGGRGLGGAGEAGKLGAPRALYSTGGHCTKAEYMVYFAVMDAKDTPILDLGAIDFTPDWARKAAGVSAGNIRPEQPASRGADGKQRAQTERKPFAGGDRKPRGSGERKPFNERREQRMRPVERPKPLNVDVKVLPETKALGTIIRKLQGDFHAYKLKDLAYFLLNNPSSVLLKLTPKAAAGGAGAAQAAGGAQAQQPVQFHQCKACSYAAVRKEDVIAHALTEHLSDYYEAREIEVEPPKGNFNCVAKCGLTGVLLGPPNRADFSSVVREMIRTRFPGMSEADYRAKIEMVRDSEAIEEWRKGATKKTVYIAKGAGENATQLTRDQAEAEFRRNILDNLLDEPRNLMITAEAAMKSDYKPLVWAVRDALEQERRMPYGMIFALRGAFHHRKFHFFRANDARGPEFVTSQDLKEFDSAHAIPELANVAKFIAEHPCQPKNVIATDAESEKQLTWLVSTGHVVAFTNGVYSAVEKFPKYGPQWQKQKKVKKQESAPAEPAPEAASAEAAPAAPEAAPAEPAPAAPEAAPAATEPEQTNPQGTTEN